MKVIRVPTDYAVTRKQKRYISKRNMVKEGKVQFCKHSYTGIKRGNFISQTIVPSFFSEHWKEFA